MKTKKILIFSLAILLILSLNFFQKEIKNFFYNISLPFQKFFWKIGEETGSFFKLVFKMKDLEKEKELLRLENQKLLAENLALRELKKENEFLKKVLEINSERKFKFIFTQIIEKEIGKETIKIEKGARDGISLGLPVITEGKVLIGKITKVYENFSKVTLLTNKNFSFNVKIGEREIYGVAKGGGNFKIFLEFLPLDQEIREGEIVVSTVLGGDFPENLLVGKIKKVQRSDISSFQEAEVLPAFKVEDLKYLLVIERW
jgi:rod shape-determining protein MreC